MSTNQVNFDKHAVLLFKVLFELEIDGFNIGYFNFLDVQCQLMLFRRCLLEHNFISPGGLLMIVYPHGTAISCIP